MRINCIKRIFILFKKFFVTQRCFSEMNLPEKPGPGMGVLPYMGYIGMCGPKGKRFFSCFGHK